MPWQVKDVDKFKKGLTDKEKEKWVRIANEAIEACVLNGGDDDSCAPRAIRIANSQFKADEVAWGSFQEIKATDEFQLILPIGNWHHFWYGEIEITKETCEDMVANWEAKVLGERDPYIDTDHDGGGANGWVTGLEARENGLYAKIKWTEQGKELLKKGIYKYFSAEIGDHMDIHTGLKVKNVLIAATLTNRPFMNTMPKAHLSDGKHSAHSDGDKKNLGGELKMKTFEEVLQALKELTLSDEQKQQLVKTAEIKMSDPKADTDTKPDPEKLQLTEKVQLQTEQLKLVLDENKSLSKELTDRKAADLTKKKGEVIEKALSDGKILPKNKEKWEAMFEKDPEGTESLLSEKGKEIDLSEKGDGSGGGEGGDEDLQLSDKEVLKNMGFTDKQIEGGDK